MRNTPPPLPRPPKPFLRSHSLSPVYRYDMNIFKILCKFVLAAGIVEVPMYYYALIYIYIGTCIDIIIYSRALICFGEKPKNMSTTCYVRILYTTYVSSDVTIVQHDAKWAYGSARVCENILSVGFKGN